tara:strand:- start:210 stop:437 length:228 start_codon:yes stop_codon:yes gene_type:complete
MRKIHLEDRVVEYRIYKSGVVQIRDQGKKIITSVNEVCKVANLDGPYYCDCGCGRVEGGTFGPRHIKRYVELVSV